MSNIIITGHRNPDMDAVCAAWAWAEYKNIIDPENKYTPVRCGTLNNQTKAAFKKAGVEPPSFMKDVSPKVEDVTKSDLFSLDINEPVYKAIKVLDDQNISCIPIFEDGENFRGIITMHQISSFLISENISKRPIYRFRMENFQKVVPGWFLKKGKHCEFDAPIMTGAMTLEVSLERIEALKPKTPVLVVGLRANVISFAVENGFPAIIITGVNDKSYFPDCLEDYNGTVYISETDTAETIRLLRLSAPVKDIMNTEPEIIPAESSFDEAKELLVNSRYRGLPVFKDDNFLGVVTRRCFIEKPKKKLVLVDHNEISQSVPGAEQSDIIEIIDHHRVSPQPTKTPIYMNIRPVGSTCTIVFNHFEASGIKIDSKTGLLLLSGILSDTVILKSPTTTAVDRVAAEKLSKICGISVENYGKELLANSAVLTKTSAKDLINGDFKSYDMKGFAFGVGQVEVITFSGIEELKNTIIDELLVTCRKKNIDWAMLLITDVIKENSLLISANCIEAENKLIYKKLDENLFDLPGVLSRKKQLLPELFRVCDELR